MPATPCARRPAHRRLHLCGRLHAADAFLHRRRDVLHTEAGAREPDGSQRLQQVRAERARVQFRRHLRTGPKGEGAAQHLRQADQPRGPERRRRAAAQVQRCRAAMRGQQRRHHLHLARQAARIPLDPRRGARDRGMAAAIPAQRMAERHMHIQRQRILRPGAAQPAGIVLAGQRGEMRRGRIAGVARQRRRGVAQQGFGGRGQGQGHARKSAV